MCTLLENNANCVVHYLYLSCSHVQEVPNDVLSNNVLHYYVNDVNSFVEWNVESMPLKLLKACHINYCKII